MRLGWGRYEPVRSRPTEGTFKTAERPRLSPFVRSLVAVTALLNLVYVASFVVVDRPAGGYTTLWDGWLFHIASILPAVLTALRAISDRRSRLAWWLVTAGIVLNTIANLTYTYHDLNLSPVPFPALSDISFLASYAAFAVALVLITQHQTGAVSKAVRLDGLVIGLGAAAVAVAAWFEPILAQSGSQAAVIVGLAYPLFDVVFIVIVISGLSPARFRPTWSSTALMVGAAVFAFGDIVFLTQVADDSYQPATWLECTWSLGILLFGLAPWLNHASRRPTREVSSGAAAVPTLAAITALAVIAAASIREIPVLAVWLAIAAIGAVLVRVGVTVTELRRANEAFRDARTDELTGLLNRRGFIEATDLQLEQHGTQLEVLMVDLDGFKEVNDSLGHHAGDELLTVVGERFSRAVPPGTVVARLGGDEFGIALTSGQSAAVAESLQTTLNNPVSLDGISIRVGASIGIASHPADGTTREELLRAADVAMYDSKEHHLAFANYSVERDPHSRDRLALIEELRTAIDNRAFEMHYQPTIAVQTGDVVGMEALIRWNHPTRGLLTPDNFIPLAERVGLIPAITRAVLDLSIAHLAETQRNGHNLRLSVNISALDLVDDDLPDYIRATLRANDVRPNLLTLEITETALSGDTVRAERTLNALRAEGIRISIDDFGVGYSSMSQLLKLPLDELKIDRSFIANLDDDIRAQAILAATIELGRTLGLDIVAEGVETTGALDEITDKGVETAQGFYFSKALPPRAFDKFVVATRIPTTAPDANPADATVA